ncbi:hypothetical protein GCM10009593_30800 [Microlunatus antarcticus]
MVAFAVVVLTIASYAWFGDWKPRPRRTPLPEDRTSAEVEALRRAIEAYERERDR